MYVDHLTEAQKKAYILADNRMALDAGWDEDILRIEIESLREQAYDLELTGFDADELLALFGDKETEEDDFSILVKQQPAENPVFNRVVSKMSGMSTAKMTIPIEVMVAWLAKQV